VLCRFDGEGRFGFIFRRRHSLYAPNS
jgi:hypothetical protein